MALNGEIIDQVFSDTLAGFAMRTIISLCNNIGPFFKYYYEMLVSLYQKGDIQRM